MERGKYMPEGTTGPGPEAENPTGTTNEQELHAGATANTAEVRPPAETMLENPGVLQQLMDQLRQAFPNMTDQQIMAKIRSNDERGRQRQAAEGEEIEEVGRRASTKKLPDGYYHEWINNPQMGIETSVPWPKERIAQEKHIREIMARMEIAKTDITQQMQVDFQNAQSILEIISLRDAEDETRATNKKLTLDQIEDQQIWAKDMLNEMKARFAFHKAFLAYENQSSIKAVSDAARQLAPDYYNSIFEIEEAIQEPGGGEHRFNPFLYAMQYYEDHGHEFARSNSETGRPEFSKKVQRYLLDYADRKRLGIDPNKSLDSFSDAEKKASNDLFRERICKIKMGIDPSKLVAELSETEKANYDQKFNAIKDYDTAKLQEYFKSEKFTFRERLRYDKFVSKEYEWAANMAERLFRFTGRATMYNYLVINKGKVTERVVKFDYDGVEKAEWADGGDGCDYDMRKILRMREFIKAEGFATRGVAELLDGVDIYAGDFWTRTVVNNYLKAQIPEGEKAILSSRVSQAQLEWKIKDLIEKDKYTEEEAKEKVAKLYYVVTPVSQTTKEDLEAKTKEYMDKDNLPRAKAEELARAYYERFHQADILGDREGSDNKGEEVKRINFLLMRRTKNTGLNFDEMKDSVDGRTFSEMGTTPMGLWATRYVDGPESARKPLSDEAKAFLRLPTFETLGALINTFDYSKAESWKTKKQLLINFIKFARSRRGDTGKQRLSEEEILSGVNKLTGLTDENAPQFVQLQERLEVLQDYFDIKISKKDRAKIEKQATIEAQLEVDLKNVKQLPPNSDEYKAELENTIEKIKNRMVNEKLNGIIENRINRKFIASFAGWFAYGAVKAGLESFWKEITK